MTKHEILDWIAGRYNLNTRSTEGKQCKYFGPEGKRCAISAMCRDDEETKAILSRIDEGDTSGYGTNASKIQPLMKEEFAGHETMFYNDCQSFHDDATNWSSFGLSVWGIDQLGKLKSTWINN